MSRAAPAHAAPSFADKALPSGSLPRSLRAPSRSVACSKRAVDHSRRRRMKSLAVCDSQAKRLPADEQAERCCLIFARPQGHFFESSSRRSALFFSGLTINPAKNAPPSCGRYTIPHNRWRPRKRCKRRQSSAGSCCAARICLQCPHVQALDPSSTPPAPTK